MPRQQQQNQQLAELAQLVQILNAVQGPQLQQQQMADSSQTNRLQLALQAYGLTQQADQQMQMRALQERELGQRSQQFGQEMQYKDRALTAETAQRDKGFNSQMFNDLNQNPGTDPEMLWEFGRQISPAYGAAFDKATASKDDRVYNQLAPQLAMLKDPKQRDLMLAGVSPGVRSRFQQQPPMQAMTGGIPMSDPQDMQRRRALEQLYETQQFSSPELLQSDLKASPYAQDFNVILNMLENERRRQDPTDVMSMMKLQR